MRLITVDDDRDTPEGAAGEDPYLPQIPIAAPGTSASSPRTASSGVLPMCGHERLNICVSVSNMVMLLGLVWLLYLYT